MDAAAHVEVTLDADAPRVQSRHQVVQYAIGHGFVKGPFVAKRPQIELQRLELDAFGSGHVADPDGSKVRLSSDGAHTRELWTIETDFIFPVRLGVRECVERP